MLLNFVNQMWLFLSSINIKIFCAGHILLCTYPSNIGNFRFFENQPIAVHFRLKIQKLIFWMEFFKAIPESSLYRDYENHDKKSLIMLSILRGTWCFEAVNRKILHFQACSKHVISSSESVNQREASKVPYILQGFIV